MPRLPEERRYYLQGLMRSIKTNPGEIHEKHLFRFNKTIYLQDFEVFQPLKGVHISQIVDKLQVIKVFEGDDMQMDRIKGLSPLVIVESGKIELKGPERVLTLNEDEYFGGFFLDENKLSEYSMKAVSDAVVYFLDISDFLSVLTNFRNQAKEFMEKIEENDLVKT